MSRQRVSAPHARVLGVGDAVGAGDSYLLTEVLPTELGEMAFERLKEEVKWQTMHHRGK